MIFRTLYHGAQSDNPVFTQYAHNILKNKCFSWFFPRIGNHLIWQSAAVMHKPLWIEASLGFQPTPFIMYFITAREMSPCQQILCAGRWPSQFCVCCYGVCVEGRWNWFKWNIGLFCHTKHPLEHASVLWHVLVILVVVIFITWVAYAKKGHTHHYATI